MTLKEIKRLIDEGKFYRSKAWRSTRQVALERDNFECQFCKEQGLYTKANVVHHIKHLRDRIDLALDLDNLISCCEPCHNKEHPERFEEFRLKQRGRRKPITEEWW